MVVVKRGLERYQGLVDPHLTSPTHSSIPTSPLNSLFTPPPPLQDLEPSHYLKDPSVLQDLEHQLSPLNKAPPKDHLTSFNSLPTVPMGEMEVNLEINMPPPSMVAPTQPPPTSLPLTDLPPATQVWYQDINTVTSLTNYMVINEVGVGG